ncbi:hypothetical protein [Polyangium aurulentum]|uniref:hypothetical protein n=1 Tax=Polyangium aurulentum TaxID=2567896 RepID=UPI0010AE9329|nr:hypothetical protein [Polyangium aurulentum]UQA57222.1 hypothetical protein E8A73_038945 [Polyangium aurulentum]
MKSTPAVAAMVLATSLALAPAPPAFAEIAAERSAAAQVLFDQAMDLLDRGRAAEACPKLEESQRLDPGMGTQFRLAECYEKIGRSASAWALYREVAEAARVAGQSEREELARKRAQAIAPRLSLLTLVVPPALAGSEGLEIRRDGVIVGRSAWGTAVPIDPGEHTIAASAPGKRVWHGKVVAGEEGKALVVRVPALEDDPDAPAGAEEGHSTRHGLAPAITLGGLATVGVGVGVLFLALSGKSRSEASEMREGLLRENRGCVAGSTNYAGARCDTLADTWKSADHLQDAAVVSLAVGGAAVAGALTYVFWPSKSSRSDRRAHSTSPVVSPYPGGVVVSGSF